MARPLTALFVFAVPSAPGAKAAGSEELAKELADPILSLISVPFQYNYDCCFGPSDADRHLLNIQPVVPVKPNSDLSLVIRTILSVVYLEAPAPGLDNTFGLRGTLQSFFLVPKTSPSGVTSGVGPAILWPTGTDDLIDSGKWAAGPTGVILKQQGGWTYGVLTNHLWSFADANGDNNRPEINETFIQPFLAYTWKDSTTLTLNSEFLYDWTAKEWTVPINLIVSHAIALWKATRGFGSRRPRVCGQTLSQSPRLGRARPSHVPLSYRRLINMRVRAHFDHPVQVLSYCTTLEAHGRSHSEEPLWVTASGTGVKSRAE